MSSLSPPVLLIRADASRMPGGIGIGHAMRCLALARAWLGRGGTASLLTLQVPADIRARFESASVGVDAMAPAAPAGSEEDARLTNGAVERLGASWLVLDGYDFTKTYQDLVSDSPSLLVIDDHGHAGRYKAQLILDQNAEADADDYSRRPVGSVLLLGPRFALVAPEFRTIKRPPGNSAARRIAFLLGGAPSESVVQIAVRAGTDLALSGLDVTVVGGTPGPDFGFRWLASTEDVPGLLREADICVAAAGITAWECCCAGVPSLLFSASANQVPVARSAARAGAAVDLGSAGELDALLIVSEVKALARDADRRRAMARAGRSLVDGAGPARVVDEMWPRIRLRSAEREDAKVLWTWANDPAVRRASFSEEPIDWDGHVHWLNARLADPDTMLFLAVSPAGEPAGQVRFDRAGSEATISLSIDSRARNSGLSPTLIRLGIAAMNREWPDVSTVVALIKVDNHPSVNAFEGSGFHSRGEVFIDRKRALRYELGRHEFSVRR